jgi:riboflavin kinase/FMN adenylyltransferase
MEVVRLDGMAARGWPSPAVAIGNFDGVHRGHAALVGAAARARAAGGCVVALTFDPHPARLVVPERAPATLTTLAQKKELLEALGVEKLAVLPFTHELSAMSAQEFARQALVGALEARTVIVGENFRFGRDREGGVRRLKTLGADLGFGVEVVEPVLHEDRPISSSRVREALGRGAVEQAEALLGHPFFVDGVVVEGERRGRTLGFPTANLQTENETLPSSGVYAVRCRVSTGQWVPGVANLGHRPTFGGTGPSVEAHLIGFDADLYGSRLRLQFEARVRDEQRFSGPEALVEQIRKDVEHARGLMADPRAKGV